MVAMINNGGGFYRPEIYLHEGQALWRGAAFTHLNHSNFHTSITGKDIYLGFHF